ncbi:hypothetical protein PspLS_11847 [Pyricularia sp. CBS 133598]|nr:hypothetical protein PspLS_11847 [Pyricularia sp. CBS 133598]
MTSDKHPFLAQMSHLLKCLQVPESAPFGCIAGDPLQQCEWVSRLLIPIYRGTFLINVGSLCQQSQATIDRPDPTSTILEASPSVADTFQNPSSFPDRTLSFDRRALSTAWTIPTTPGITSSAVLSIIPLSQIMPPSKRHREANATDMPLSQITPPLKRHREADTFEREPKITPEDFTIGWICALPIELAAAVEIMDEEFADLPSHPTDFNIYSFGRIGNHNVVAACLPAGQMGTNQAAVVASQMNASFPSLRFGVLVGIGGGVPNLDADIDIRLGDVVISQPAGHYGGVVQYDFGKTGADGLVTRTGSLNAPPMILLNSLAKLRANDFRDRTQVVAHLSKLSSQPKFASPGPENDMLYEALSQHKGGVTCLQKSLSGLDKDAVEKKGLAIQFEKLLWLPLQDCNVDQYPWPTVDDLDHMVQLATTPEPLFIYAATLCRFVYDEKRPCNPKKRLNLWLKQCEDGKSQLHQIYDPVLNQVFLGNEEAESGLQLQFLGAIILLATPLPGICLTVLLGLDVDDVNWWLPELHAVLEIPPEPHRPIRLLHKSFSDFLLSPKDSGISKHYINATETHAMLAARCIERMEAGLRRDICNIGKSDVLKDKIDKQVIDRQIPADLDAPTYLEN